MLKYIALTIDPYTNSNRPFHEHEDACYEILRSFKKEASKNKEHIGLFLLSTLETIFPSKLYESTVLPLREVAVSLGINNVYFIVDESSMMQLKLTHLGCKFVNYKEIPLISVQFYLIWSHHRIFVDKQPYNTQLNDTNKCLFLTGKANGQHRIGLLSKFYKQNLMSQLEWSLFVNKEISDSCQEYTGMTDSEYDVFVTSCVKNPDNIDIDIQATSTHYPGYPYDVSLFKNTSLSLISETTVIENRTGAIFFTEKTWKAIINHHPFLLASTLGALTKLEEMGFRVFRKYMAIPHYDSIIDIEERMQAIVTNTKYFLDNYSINKDQIKEDVHFNYNQYLVVVKKEFDKINAITGPGVAEKIMFSPEVSALHVNK